MGDLTAVGLFLFALGAACNCVIEACLRLVLGTGLPDGPQALRFVIGSVVITSLVGLLAAVTGRLWLTSGVMLATSTALGLVNALKLHLRFEPVYPADVTMAGQSSSLLEMVGWRPIVLTFVTVLAVILAVVLVARIAATTGFGEVSRRWAGRESWGARAVALGLSLAVLLTATGFSHRGNLLRSVYQATGSQWSEGSQALIYAKQGFVGGTLANLHPVSMAKPKGYTRAAMHRLLVRYSRVSVRANQHRRAAALSGVNVVVVLSESFTDPTRLRGLRLSEDPEPYTRSIMQSTTSGRMLSPSYGGGTANVEFEALTGFSMSQLAPSLTYPYSMLVARRPHFPSVVDLLANEGHRTVAVHPYLRSFYSRDRVYRSLGFDRFIAAADMHFTALDGGRGYISDRSAYREALRQLTTSRSPILVNLVTMQNHPTYDGHYSDPVATNLSGQAGREAGNYLRGVTHSDAALREFLSHVEQIDEPTAVVFFGDHQPGFWPDSVKGATGLRGMHETPYFIWTNVQVPRPTTPPTTSPVFFMPELLERVDAPEPPFYALLASLQREVAAMDAGLLADPQGRLMSAASLSARARQLLEDYRLVQYDVVQGHGYLPASFFDTPA